MAFNLRNRSFLTLADFNTREMEYMLDLAENLKKAKYAGTEQQHLKGKNIALIFEKSSTRTRCSFEVGAKDQGAHVTYLAHLVPTLATRNPLRIPHGYSGGCSTGSNTVVSPNVTLKFWPNTLGYRFGTG